MAEVAYLELQVRTSGTSDINVRRTTCLRRPGASHDTWKREIESVQKLGYAVDRGDYISGVTVIAVPLVDPQGRMTHSIVFIDISERIEAIGVSGVVKKMTAIRDEVQDLLVRAPGE